MVFTQGRNREVQLSEAGPAGWLTVIGPASDEVNAGRSLDELVAFAREAHPNPADWEKAQADAKRVQDLKRYRTVEIAMRCSCGQPFDPAQL